MEHIIHVKKMHGCGNDFCVIPYDNEIIDYNELARKICNRKTGIGADGMVVCKREPNEVKFYTSDGTRINMNGNGIRCYARFCLEEGDIIKHGKMTTLAGSDVIDIEITSEEPFECKVNMDKPIFNNRVVYANDPIDVFDRLIKVKDKTVRIYSFYMGAINTIIFVNSFNDEILSYADDIYNHSLFARKTNVSFVKINNEKSFDVKSYTKTGWSLACGTGCCASVVAALKLGKCKTKVRCNLELGYLDIEVNRKGEVLMSGPAVKVFECDYKFEEE